MNIIPQNQTKETQTSTTYSSTIDASYYKGHQGSGTLIKVGNIYPSEYESGRVYSDKGIARALKGESGDKTGMYMISHTDANMKQRYQKRDTAWTLDTSGNKMAVEDRKSRVRRLTPKECERLQGFPDDWTAGVSDTQRYRQCGNSVMVPKVKYIADVVTKSWVII